MQVVKIKIKYDDILYNPKNTLRAFDVIEQGDKITQLQNYCLDIGMVKSWHFKSTKQAREWLRDGDEVFLFYDESDKKLKGKIINGFIQIKALAIVSALDDALIHKILKIFNVNEHQDVFYLIGGIVNFLKTKSKKEKIHIYEKEILTNLRTKEEELCLRKLLIEEKLITKELANTLLIKNIFSNVFRKEKSFNEIKDYYGFSFDYISPIHKMNIAYDLYEINYLNQFLFSITQSFENNIAERLFVTLKSIIKDYTHKVQWGGKEFLGSKEYFEKDLFIFNFINSKIKRSQLNLERRDFEEKLKNFEQTMSQKAGFVFKFNNEQRQGIYDSIKNDIFALSGPAGTGKTTTLSAIIEMNKIIKGYETITKIAPTGKAAERMGGITIHKFLKWGENGPLYTMENKIDTDMIIIDECSMVDLDLLYALLQAIPEKTKVIFVGDYYQLPSISRGQFFSDILGSPNFPKVSLTQVMRQKGESSILDLATKLRQKEDLEIFNHKDLSANENSEDLYSGVIKTEKNLEYVLNKFKQLFASEDISNPNFNTTIISTQKDFKESIGKINLGTNFLNQRIQEYINPDGEFLFWNKNKIYKKNDMIICSKNGLVKNKNNQEFQFVNGLVLKLLDYKNGMVLAENKEGKKFIWTLMDYKSFELAYAITVHKSQGSEWENVIFVGCERGNKSLLTTEMFYTAVTRAKKKLILAVDDKNIYQYLVNKNVESSYSFFGFLIRNQSGVKYQMRKNKNFNIRII